MVEAKTAPVTDVVVVLPGIMGSTLAKHGRLVWAPSAGAVLRAVWTFGRSVKDLGLPAGIADDHPADGVEPVALMPDLHVLLGLWTANIGYGKLLDFLRSPRFGLVEAGTVPPDHPVNLVPVPYDWRLSNRFNARRLKSIVEPVLDRWRGQGGVYKNAGLVFICHSMGGLVARWYIEREGGAGHTRKLVTIGTPHRGALSALDQSSDEALAIIADRTAEDQSEAIIHHALLTLLRLNQVDRAYEAIMDPAQLHAELAAARGDADPTRLIAYATLGMAAASNDADTAQALFHLALGQALTDAPVADQEYLLSAMKLAPGQVPVWLDYLSALLGSRPDRQETLIALSRTLLSPPQAD
jgi:hypothetical protein